MKSRLNRITLTLLCVIIFGFTACNNQNNNTSDRTFNEMPDIAALISDSRFVLTFGLLIISMLILAFLLTMFFKSRDEGRRLAKLIAKTNEANRLKNISISSMEIILNSIDAMIYVTVPETGEILFINDCMKKHYDLEGDCIGQLCYKILQKNFTQRCDFCPCFKLDTDPDSVIVWEEHSSLTGRHYRNVDRYIAWPNGQIVHMQHSVDTTDLVTAKEFAERSSRYKSSFLANMSHEIRTPMNTILGIAEIQLQDLNKPPETEDAFRKIYESGDMLLNIINDILDLSKIEAGKLETVSINYDIPSLINDTALLNRLRYDSNPVEFNLRIDPNTPLELSGDELRIKQVLNNLLSNAFKYTKEGSVELYVSADTENGGETSVNDNDDVMLIFRVSDTGQGMTEQQIEALFDEYTRFNVETNRAISGTGLGMSITMRLVNLMNGKINVESEPEKGSVFTICIPQKRVGSMVCGTELAGKLQDFRFQSSTITKKTQFIREYMPYGSVLIVDDTESNIYVTKGMLHPYGLKIETASSGFEAIGKIKNGNVYDIIFMDHMMPKMDGITAAGIIRETGYQNCIIALTANAIIGRAEMFMQNGFDGFISKPIDSRELNSALNEFIRNKKPQEAVEEARRIQNERNKTRGAETEAAGGSSEKIKFFIIDAENAINTLNDLNTKLPVLDNEETRLYITTVHGMKSALANINEHELSALAKRLEYAGEDGDFKILSNETAEFLNTLKSLVNEIKPAAEENNDGISGEDSVHLKEKLNQIKTACDTFDKKTAKTILEELKEKMWPKLADSFLDEISIHLLHSSFRKASSAIENFIKEN